MSNLNPPSDPSQPTPGAENLARSSRDKTRGRPFGSDNPGRPFPPGNSGRPKGCRDKSSTVLARLFDGEAEEVGRRAVELAKEGRVGCVRLVLDNAMRVRRNQSVSGVTLPPMTTAADAVTAMSAIMAAVSAGTIGIADARDLAGMVEIFRKTLELADIEQRIEALEEQEPAHDPYDD